MAGEVMDQEQQVDAKGRNGQPGQFEERRLALEVERIKFDRQRASIELLLKRRELSAAKTKGWREILANPLTLAIVGGFITIMTTILTSHFSASAGVEAETVKAQQALQADLIKRFVDNPNPQTVRTNLQFLVDVGLVPSYAKSLRSFLDKTPNSALPSSFTPPTGGLQNVHTDDDAIDFAMRFHGGFINDPLDPGGATNFGISIHDLSNYLGKLASTDDVRNLSVETAGDIYKKRYLIGGASGLSSVQVKAAYLALATQIGAGRAVKFFQIAIGKIDHLPVSENVGVFDSETVQRINAIEPDLMIETVNCDAAKYFETLSTFNHFGPTWMRRLRMSSPVTLKGICPELQAIPSDGGTTPPQP